MYRVASFKNHIAVLPSGTSSSLEWETIAEHKTREDAVACAEAIAKFEDKLFHEYF